MGPDYSPSIMPSSHDTWNTALDLHTMMRSDRTDQESILQPETALAITLDPDATLSLTSAEREAALAREAALTLITMRYSKPVDELDEAPALDPPVQSVDPEAVRQEEALALASLTSPEAEAIARLEAACALVSLAHSADPDTGSAARRETARDLVSLARSIDPDRGSVALQPLLGFLDYSPLLPMQVCCQARGSHCLRVCTVC